MATVSHELSGVILSHDHYRSHLDDQRRTIDDELELRNFNYAGKLLVDVWLRLVVDGHLTMAEYIEPYVSELKEENIVKRPQSWMELHLRTSQYFTQVVKCADLECCSTPS